MDPIIVTVIKFLYFIVIQEATVFYSIFICLILINLNLIYYLIN